MIVLPADNTGSFARMLHKVYGSIGSLVNAYNVKVTPSIFPFWAIDNGAYIAYLRKERFNEEKFLKGMMHYINYGYATKPRWIVVPDMVGDKNGTLFMWHLYAPQLRTLGIDLAFAAQDGMTPADVPSDADIVFLGGSTEFKLKAVPLFCREVKRVHVGRVNTYGRLVLCAENGAESCDGTGFFRGDRIQLYGLVRFLAEQAGMPIPSPDDIYPPLPKKRIKRKAKA